MDLILWRHAEAEDAAADGIDANRRLTARGHAQARTMARWLAQVLPEGTQVIASPALRTRQTVEPLGRPVRYEPACACGADPQALLAAAGWPRAGHPVLVVGHQPTLGQVAALLLAGQARQWTVRRGNVWWIAGDGGGEAADCYLKAVMAPDLIVR